MGSLVRHMEYNPAAVGLTVMVSSEGGGVKSESISIWQGIVIVFIASFCTLVIEIVAGRLLAPYMGVNLYTWTSIIGVVLAGISLGNFVGGWLADRRASRSLLGLLFFASALATLAILPLLELMVSAGSGLKIPLMLKVVVYVTVIFFTPAFIMGTITPIVVRLCLTSLERSGKTVGLLYACSTLGSILGTFLTGFFLISTFGTRAIVVGVAIILGLTGLLAGAFWRTLPRATSAAHLVAFLVVAGAIGYALQTERHISPFDRETDYYTIRISQRAFEDGSSGYSLVLDHLIHSFSDPNDPTKLEYGYERVYRELTALHAEQHPNLRTAFIGGGGYTYPRFIEAVYPRSTIHVVEIDPAVTQIARERLGVRPDSRIIDFNEDARLYFNRFAAEATAAEKYDIIYGDAFNDIAVPYHLTTAEFDRLIADSLAPDGVYMVNIIDSYTRGEFLKAYVRSLKLSFPHVYVVSLGQAYRNDGASTYVVLAAKQPLDVDALERVATKDGRSMLSTVIPSAELEAHLATGRQVLLTDDYVPVDQMLAWLFEERGF
ncbi:MAG: fused MFS/spermidine synthase [Chloroflexi bacterium]|nr:fused MFS/spermidine synthase [Chloroflexota bacterium]